MFYLDFFENSPLGIKLGAKIRLHHFDITDHETSFLSIYRRIGAHRTSTQLTTSHIPTCSFWSRARIVNDSRQSSVCVAKKEMSEFYIYSPSRSIILNFQPKYMDISFFSILIYIYTRYDCDTEQTYSFWEDLILQLSFSKSILNYAPNTIAFYSFIFIYRCYFNNCASWSAWFFFSFVVTSLSFK